MTGTIAGKGKPFDISYDFKYTVQIVPEYFFIQSAVNPAYSLDINGGSHDNEANVQIYNFNLSDSQKFSISKYNDYVFIVSKVSGKVFCNNMNIMALFHSNGKLLMLKTI